MKLQVIHKKGYNVIEFVPGTFPVYDEDKITHETAQLFPELREEARMSRILYGSSRINSCCDLSRASERMVEGALASVC